MPHLEFELLSAYLDDEVSVAERAQVEAHLAGCTACQGELAALRGTVSLVQRLPEQPLPRTFYITEALLGEGEPRRAGWWGWLRGWRTMAPAATLVAALLLLMVLWQGSALPGSPAMDGAAESAAVELSSDPAIAAAPKATVQSEARAAPPQGEGDGAESAADQGDAATMMEAAPSNEMADEAGMADAALPAEAAQSEATPADAEADTFELAPSAASPPAAVVVNEAEEDTLTIEMLSTPAPMATAPLAATPASPSGAPLAQPAPGRTPFLLGLLLLLLVVGAVVAALLLRRRR